jgi:hypothetical protein
MSDEGSLPRMRAQERGEDRRRGVYDTDPALPPLCDVLGAALRRRVAQRAARDQTA